MNDLELVPIIEEPSPTTLSYVSNKMEEENYSCIFRWCKEDLTDEEDMIVESEDLRGYKSKISY